MTFLIWIKSIPNDLFRARLASLRLQRVLSKKERSLTGVLIGRPAGVKSIVSLYFRYPIIDLARIFGHSHPVVHRKQLF
jgi:hypothetical protein